MRLDHFLPFLRPVKADRLPVRRSRGYSWLRRWLPASVFSQQRPKRAGLFRKGLIVLGTGWETSPWRRGVQTVSFIGFLWLFFYVCWPYHATPGSTWSGWIPEEVDVVTGRIRLSNDLPPFPRLQPGQTYYVWDESDPGGERSLLPFVASSVDETNVVLERDSGLSQEALEELSLSVGPWTLSDRPPGAWPDHYANNLESKEVVPVDLFLAMDPLVSLSTSIAARAWVWSLTVAGVILLVCLFIPRGFCGYLCPLGTLIDLFDGTLGKRWKRWRVKEEGWWVHLKYYLLAAVFAASICGVLISGFFAAIPVITRGLLFVVSPLQLGLVRGWNQVPPITVGQLVSVLLFFLVLALGFLRPRFWCKYVCPSGAIFSLANVFRINERKVEQSCIHCNRCIEVCPFDAIKPDFTTRVTDCTFCQTCGGACPTGAIKFVERGNRFALKLEDDPPTHETRIGRRGFLSTMAGVGGGLAGGLGVSLLAKSHSASPFPPVRPPGSVPEEAFLDLCIRCGECFQVCPNNVLQPAGWLHGFNSLWTPEVKADWAGCEPSCNACGQVCPTGAIRPLPLEQKKQTRMGLAEVRTEVCLPWADQEPCQLCVDECDAAGYHAIEFVRVHRQHDALGQIIADSGLLAPQVLADRCVGCGLCQTRCYSVFVKDQRRFEASAIVIYAGPGKEDRFLKPLAVPASNRSLSDDPVSTNSIHDSTYLPSFLDSKSSD